MRYFKKSVKGFDDLQTYLHLLYGDVNTGRSWDYLFGYLVRSCGFMSVNVSRAAAPEQFIRAVSWLFGLGNKLGVRVVDQYVRRFPRICYYCITAPCICFKTGKQPSPQIAAYKIQERREVSYRVIVNSAEFEKDPMSFEWLSKNVATIYPNNEVIWFHSGPWHHFTKLLEELAELHQALSKHETGEDVIENVGQEIADVFAWIVATWQLAIPGKDLQEEFIGHYYKGCPVCSARPVVALQGASGDPESCRWWS